MYHFYIFKKLPSSNFNLSRNPCYILGLFYDLITFEARLKQRIITDIKYEIHNPVIFSMGYIFPKL